MSEPADRIPFSVWAPRATELHLVIGESDAEFAMQRDADGWWHPTDLDAAAAAAAAPDASPVEADYGYRIDGEGPFADPRSRRQPNGVHGLSRTFDASAFEWLDDEWAGRDLAGAIIYELHVGTFTEQGTFDSAVAKLDHLSSIGVGFVELLPVNAFNGIYNWGYDGVLWFAVHEPYGGPAGYQRFVDACHARGIGVIQDVVYNHLGPSGNHLPRFAPYLRDDKANTWGSAINLDGSDSDEVRRYILDNAAMWLRDYHVDGLRLDAVHALSDNRAVHILEELAGEVQAISEATGRPLALIAESDLNDPRLIEPRSVGGYGLDAQWSDDFHHAVHVALTGETQGYFADFAAPDALAKVIAGGFFHDGSYSSFRGRGHGRPIRHELTQTWRLVVSSQNHDQIGNRATGDRLVKLLDEGQLAIAAALTLLGPFTPMLFMGEEWAASTPWQFFTSHPEPELGEVTAKGRFAEFERMGWDESLVPHPQDPATFERSKLRWDEAGHGAHKRMLEFYRALARLRAEVADFTDPQFTSIHVRSGEPGTWLALDRGETTLAVNFGAEPARLPIPLALAAATEAGATTDSAAPLVLALTFGDAQLADAEIVLGPHALAVALRRR